MMKQLFESSQLFGSNAPFIEELYENYLENPDSVSEEWRSYFDSMQNQPGAARDVAHYPIINAFAEMAKRRRAVTGLPRRSLVSCCMTKPSLRRSFQSLYWTVPSTAGRRTLPPCMRI